MAGQPITGAGYKHISANGSGVLKSAPGSLFSVTINTKGAASNVLTLYDNTAASGTVLAVIDTTSQITVLDYYLDFAVGLSYALATGTAADVTISFS
jgi:hypothetical protein